MLNPRIIASIVCLFPCTGAVAQVVEKIISPTNFERISTGKTLYFHKGGVFFGAEQYFEGNETIWQTPDGTCQYGKWFSVQNNICFVYDDDPTPVCWNLIKSGETYSARIPNDDLSYDLILQSSDTRDLICPAPELNS